MFILEVILVWIIFKILDYILYNYERIFSFIYDYIKQYNINLTALFNTIIFFSIYIFGITMCSGIVYLDNAHQHSVNQQIIDDFGGQGKVVEVFALQHKGTKLYVVLENTSKQRMTISIGDNSPVVGETWSLKGNQSITLDKKIN